MRTRRLDPTFTPEYRAAMGAILVICGLGVLGSVVPAVEHLMNLGTLGLVALAALLVLMRFVVRFVRERLEDAADTRTAAAWRAAHPAHGRTPAGVS